MPTSTSSRPDWVHPARTARAFWTPAVLVLGVSVALFLCWPHGEWRGAGTRAMPEPAAAYVVLDGSKAHPFSPTQFVLPSQGFGKPFSSLDEFDRAPVRQLPPPAYSEVVRIPSWAPTAQGLGSNAPPDLADWPLAADLVLSLPPATNGVQVSISLGLKQSGFLFDVPVQVATTQPASATFHLELDTDGRVAHVLAEPSEDPPSARLIEAALNRGHGTRAGRGEVQVSWGR